MPVNNGNGYRHCNRGGKSVDRYLIEVRYRPRPQLNGNSTRCPKCGRYGGKLIRENTDLYCLVCGWRESCFFGYEKGLDSNLIARLIYNDLSLAPV